MLCFIHSLMTKDFELDHSYASLPFKQQDRLPATPGWLSPALATLVSMPEFSTVSTCPLTDTNSQSCLICILTFYKFILGLSIARNHSYSSRVYPKPPKNDSHNSKYPTIATTINVQPDALMTQKDESSPFTLLPLSGSSSIAPWLLHNSSHSSIHYSHFSGNQSHLFLHPLSTAHHSPPRFVIIIFFVMTLSNSPSRVLYSMSPPTQLFDSYPFSETTYCDYRGYCKH